MSRRVLDVRTRRRARRARPRRRSRACARRPGRSPRTPRRCTRRCSGWATSRTRRRAPWQALARRAGRRPAASCARATAGSPAEATRDPKAVLRGRLEALGPVFAKRRRRPDAAAARARGRGRRPARRASTAARPGATAGCSRASTATRSTACAARSSRSPPRSSCASSPAGSTSTPSTGSTGPRGVAEVVAQLAGFEVPARGVGGERSCPRACAATSASGSTSSRSRARSPGAGSGARAPVPIRRTPISLRPARGPRGLAARRRRGRSSGADRHVAARPGNPRGRRRDVLSRSSSGPPDSPRPSSRRPGGADRTGPRDLRLLSGLRCAADPAVAARAAASRGRTLEPARAGNAARRGSAEFVARQLLRRTGVVFRKTLEREKQPLPWRDDRPRAAARSRRAARSAAAASWPASTASSTRCPKRSRAARRAPPREEAMEPAAVTVSAADPLNFRGILTPDERVAPTTRRQVLVA